MLSSCATDSDASSTAIEPKTINEEEFNKLAKDSNTVIIDVRTPGEVSEGYISGATLFFDYNDANFESNIEKLDKYKGYIVYCRSGGRSSKAAEILTQKGIKKVYNLDGGISNWTGELKH
ncbi:MAG: rhodanese-like domain-containing protein [Crocinitomicaceae bacterium]|nr:rhodanese-like domain-containing protein [Crocinitomicaceae bacterium]MCF8411271.1 rhodanese-like domain-containing protein [Crocinitomicaceae bacterium]MCF8445020.1 rhodanese-like domain-containing protein [Crocinitomicaceae bacterium]